MLMIPRPPCTSNRIGARSVSGEGGEVPERYRPLPNGDNPNSAVKQVASGLLGVEIREEIIGIAEVRDVFRSSKLGAVAGSCYGSIAEAMASMSAIGCLSEPTAPVMADFHRTKRRVHGLMRKLDRESRDTMQGLH